jgi:ankyrin repeat protein
MKYNTVEDVLARLQHVVEFCNVELTSVNQTGIGKNTPLAIVAGWGDVRAARLLIDAGADVNTKVEDGETALHRAVANQRKEIIRLLLDSGASKSERDDDGRTPKELAQLMGYTSIIHLLDAE